MSRLRRGCRCWLCNVFVCASVCLCVRVHKNTRLRVLRIVGILPVDRCWNRSSLHSAGRCRLWSRVRLTTAVWRRYIRDGGIDRHCHSGAGVDSTDAIDLPKPTSADSHPTQTPMWRVTSHVPSTPTPEDPTATCRDRVQGSGGGRRTQEGTLERRPTEGLASNRTPALSGDGAGGTALPGHPKPSVECRPKNVVLAEITCVTLHPCVPFCNRHHLARAFFVPLPCRVSRPTPRK